MSINFVQFLLQLKNASLAKKETISLEYSVIRKNMVEVLYTEGFVQSFDLIVDSLGVLKIIVVNLRYYFSRSLLENLRLLSKPSHVKYMKLLDISNIPDRRFVIFFSTDRGTLTTLECKKKKVGGKLLFIC